MKALIMGEAITGHPFVLTAEGHRRLETWMGVFSLVETTTEHHDAAARLERLAAPAKPPAARPATPRRAGDAAS